MSRDLIIKKITRVIPIPLEEGKYALHESTYTEVATGISYRDSNGHWQDAVAQFELINGKAVASQTLTKVTLAANTTDIDPVVMTLPDGAALKSRMLGLAYVDRKSGQSVVIAEVQPSEGELMLGGSEIVYRNSFNGLDADIRYILTRAGLSRM